MIWWTGETRRSVSWSFLQRRSRLHHWKRSNRKSRWWLKNRTKPFWNWTLLIIKALRAKTYFIIAQLSYTENKALWLVRTILNFVYYHALWSINLFFNRQSSMDCFALYQKARSILLPFELYQALKWPRLLLYLNVEVKRPVKDFLASWNLSRDT